MKHITANNYPYCFLNNMSHYHQVRFCAALVIWLLIGCQTRTGAFTPALTATPIFTSAASLMPATESSSTLNPFPQSPFPPELASLLDTKCKRFGETIYNEFISLYGNKGCKLPALSPDGRYLAYVTLVRQEKVTNVSFADAVKVIEVGVKEKEIAVHVVHEKDYIGMLEWGQTGKLIFWEQIWEGPWAVFIYDPAQNTILTVMRAGGDGHLQWNPQHTAFYVTRTGGFGADNCVGELGGYDFEGNQPFPDLYKVFGIEERNDDPFGVPYGKSDNLYIEPFGWSQDGKRLWLTVTPLYWQGDRNYEYKTGPRQAGALALSATGIMYTPLAYDPPFDYSFQGLPQPEILSKPYQPQLCP